MSIEQGWAIRRNATCLSGYETDCGPTVSPFRACCPSGFACPTQYNAACCPPGKNCTMELVEAPKQKCANSSWDLFDNWGPFCCEHGLAGFNRSTTNVCAQPGSLLSGVILLPTLSTGGPWIASSTPASSAPSSAASSTASGSTTTQPSSSTPSSSETQQSSTPVGAIVGGVVGGVGGLALLGLVAWFVLRRKQKNPYEAPQDPHNGAHEAMGRETQPAHQLDGSQVIYEAGAGKTQYAHIKEMPANEAPVELHGDSTAPR